MKEIGKYPQLENIFRRRSIRKYKKKLYPMN